MSSQIKISHSGVKLATRTSAQLQMLSILVNPCTQNSHALELPLCDPLTQNSPAGALYFNYQSHLYSQIHHTEPNNNNKICDGMGTRKKKCFLTSSMTYVSFAYVLSLLITLIWLSPDVLSKCYYVVQRCYSS